MTERTKGEIRAAQSYLEGDGLDKDGALRGLNDWFLEGLFEEGWMATGDQDYRIAEKHFMMADEGGAQAFNEAARKCGAEAESNWIAPLPRKGHARFYKLLDELADLHERKNQNYATSEDPLKNLRECEDLGITPFNGTLVRLCDKWCRIKNLAGGVPDLVGESIVDTLKDMAIYSLLGIILWEEKHEAKADVGSFNHPGAAL